MTPLILTLVLSAWLAAVPLAAHAELGRDEAAATAQRASSGRVLALDKFDFALRPTWRVKVLTPGGVVRVLLIDAASGEVL